MSRQSRNTGGGGAAAASTTRMNEYFVPRDGIDREVISADICRYLGNDALVRPGHYDNPQTGQTVQGYYITAYRNLTTAMIEDLKADSARWDSERRALANRSMNATGGIQAARGGAGAKASVSNTELGQYRNSETHQSRQHHGPTDHNYPQENYRENSYDGGNRYPGTGTPGYNGATNYMQQQSQQPGFAPPSGGSGGYGGYQQPPQHAQDPRYNQGPGQSGSMMNQGYQDPAYVGAGANLQQQRGYQGNDNYGGRPVSTGNPQQPIYSTSAPQQPPYPPPSGSSYQYQGQMPQGNVPQYSNMQPQDPFYGRASPAGPPLQPGYQAQGQQLQQQYEETPPTRSTASPASTAQPPAGQTNRPNDRESNRQSSERLQRPPPRR